MGQMFVYQMIKEFKQHIVPFVITTRKILTVVISILFYGHATTLLQVVGIMIVFFAASYEYISEIWASRVKQQYIQPVDSERSNIMEETVDSSSQRR